MVRSASILLIILLIWDPSFGQPELVIRQGHKAAINKVIYSPDGDFVFSASDDKTIKMWDLKTGVDVKNFTGHIAAVKALNITPDGNKLISGDADGKLFIWEVGGNEEALSKIDAHEGVINTIELTKDGLSFYTGSIDEKIKKWGIQSGQLEQIIEAMTSEVRAMGISPDGTKAVVGGQKTNDVEVLLIDLTNGAILDDALKHYKAAGAAKAYTYAILSGFSIAANIAKGNVGKGMLDFYIMNYNNIEYAKDGKSILVCQNTYLPMMAAKGEEEKNGGTSVSIVELTEDGTGFKDVKKPQRWTINYPNTRAVFNEDQTKIIANIQNAIKIYDMETADFPDQQSESAAYEPPVLKEFTGDVNWLNSIALSPDYKTMVSSDDDRRIKLWDVGTGRIIRSLEGFVQPVLAVDAMPDGKHILVGSLDRDLTMWDITTGTLVRTFDRASDIIHIDVSADGNYALTASANTRFFKLWNLNNGRMLKSFLENSDNITWVKFDEEDDDLFLAGTEKGDIHIWSKSKNKIAKNLKGVNFKDYEDKYESGGYSFTSDGFSFSLKKGNTIAFESTQKGIISDATFSKDEKFLITTNELGQISMYDLNLGELKITMAQINYFDFITYTQDFYYTSSKGASKAIAFKTENKILPFEQFELKYNRPDIVAEKLGYASDKLIASLKAAYQRRLKRLGFSEESLSTTFELPEVVIDLEKLPYATEERLFSLDVAASDPSVALDRLMVFVNDVPVFGSSGVDVSGANSLNISKTLEFNLVAGLNTVDVTAINSTGTSSLPFTFDVKYEADYFKPNLYLATIGVSVYQQSKFNLKFAAKDADDIASTIEKSSIYENVYKKSFTNESATLSNIGTLRNFFEEAKEDDVVIVFIAGHGVLDNSYNYYFATHNMDFDNPQNGGLPYDKIEALLDGINCRNKLLLMDTCHSGELDSDDVESVNEASVVIGPTTFRSTGKLIKLKQNSFGLENTLELSKSLFGDLKKGTGATVISAAGGAELASDEGVYSQNGLFTSSLIQGINTRRADLDRNRSYTIREIQEYVSEQVITLSGGKQVPTSREENIKNDFQVY
ncbi:MAG: caspase family protein [Bacteroidetes bacterium]|nr:caspase family protein [Bacteroidota bacterium]